MFQYNSDKVKIAWLGLDLSEGLTTGTFVVLSQDKQTWTWVPDGLGGGIRLYNDDTSGTAQLTIDVEHPVHQRLLATAAADRLVKNLVGPMLIRDLSIGENIILKDAYIIDEPNEVRATEGSNVVWEFQYGGRIIIPNLTQKNRVGDTAGVDWFNLLAN